MMEGDTQSPPSPLTRARSGTGAPKLYVHVAHACTASHQDLQNNSEHTAHTILVTAKRF